MCVEVLVVLLFLFFFFNDTATTEIYTLSLHDALPISSRTTSCCRCRETSPRSGSPGCRSRDRKSTRLNSSHLVISYAVFCLKKKNKVHSLIRDCLRPHVHYPLTGSLFSHLTHRLHTQS